MEEMMTLIFNKSFTYIVRMKCTGQKFSIQNMQLYVLSTLNFQASGAEISISRLFV